MLEIIKERDPEDILRSDPPELPPILDWGRRPRREQPLIMPDILRCHAVNKIADHENNWYTVIYFWMNRIWGSPFDSDSKIEYATTACRKYHQWLETYDMNAHNHGLPPHISFGGCIKPGERDPTFHDRWVQYAKERFC